MIMGQGWSHVAFLHWRCGAAHIAGRLPAGLTLDLFDGAAWLSLIPFDATLFGLPFEETNLRTYVRGPDGTPGVWFFSLDCNRPLLVHGSRLLLGLPYRPATLGTRHGQRHVYLGVSEVMHYHLELGEGETLAPDALDTFLTVRYTLFSQHGARLLRQDLHHEPWPLRRAEVLALRETVIPSVGLDAHDEAPIAHYSGGVHVTIDAPRLAAPAAGGPS